MRTHNNRQSRTCCGLAVVLVMFEMTTSASSIFRIQTEDVDRIASGNLNRLTKHSGLQEFVDEASAEGDVAHPELPNVILASLANHVDLVDECVDCICAARENGNSMQKALGYSAGDFRGYAKWVVEYCLKTETARASVAINRDTRRVISCELSVDAAKVAEIYSVARKYEKLRPWADTMLYCHKKLEDSCPEKLKPMPKKRYSYMMFLSTRPGSGGKRLTTALSMFSAKHFRKVGFTGTIGVVSHPSLLRWLTMFTNSKHFNGASTRIKWDELAPIVGDDSPLLKIAKPPHLLAYCFFDTASQGVVSKPKL